MQCLHNSAAEVLSYFRYRMIIPQPENYGIPSGVL